MEKEKERAGGKRETEDDVIRVKSKDRRRGRGSGPLRHQEVAHHLHTRTVNQPTCARAYTLSYRPYTAAAVYRLDTKDKEKNIISTGHKRERKRAME